MRKMPQYLEPEPAYLEPNADPERDGDGGLDGCIDHVETHRAFMRRFDYWGVGRENTEPVCLRGRVQIIEFTEWVSLAGVSQLDSTGELYRLTHLPLDFKTGKVTGRPITYEFDPRGTDEVFCPLGLSANDTPHMLLLTRPAFDHRQSEHDGYLSDVAPISMREFAELEAQATTAATE